MKKRKVMYFSEYSRGEMLLYTYRERKGDIFMGTEEILKSFLKCIAEASQNEEDIQRYIETAFNVKTN